MRNRVLTGIGILVPALLASLTAWVVWQSRDLEVIEDSDLRIQLLPAEPHENALTYLDEAAELLVWKEEADPPTMLDALDGDLDAQALVRDLVKKNAKGLAALERALEAPILQVSLLDSFEADGEEADLTPWRRLGQVLSLRSHQRPKKRGLEDLFAALEYGRLVETASGGNLRHTMTGIAIRRDALAAFQSWIEMTPLTKAEGIAIARRLEGYATDSDAWARSWAAEYAALKGTMLQDGDRVWQYADLAGEPSWSLGILPEDYLFQPNRTIHGFAERYRILGANAGLLCSQLAPLDGPLEEDFRPAGLPAPNAGGEALLASATPNLERFQYRRCTVDARLAATQVMAGVRSYWDVHRDLPETLDELVPDHLEALPADPFDGETLRWNLKHAWVYSVGDDFVDEGGRVSLVADDMSEPTYRFLFCAVPFGERARPARAARRHRVAPKPSSETAAAIGECRPVI